MSRGARSSCRSLAGSPPGCPLPAPGVGVVDAGHPAARRPVSRAPVECIECWSCGKFALAAPRTSASLGILELNRRLDAPRSQVQSASESSSPDSRPCTALSADISVLRALWHPQTAALTLIASPRHFARTTSLARCGWTQLWLRCITELDSNAVHTWSAVARPRPRTRQIESRRAAKSRGLTSFNVCVFGRVHTRDTMCSGRDLTVKKVLA